MELPPPPPQPIFFGDESSDDELIPPPPPQVFCGVELVGNRNRIHWSGISDESDDVVPSAAMFFPGAEASSFSLSSSGKHEAQSFYRNLS